MNTKYYLFQKNKVVFKIGDDMPLPVTRQEFEKLSKGYPDITEVRVASEKECLAVELPEHFDLPRIYSRTTLRSLVGAVDDHLFIRWGKASQLLHWYKSHRYCGFCGSPTRQHPSEYARHCTKCGECHYPSISPCIIVLVSRGDEILLARSPRFPKKMYSTLAGFIEPGESAEQTIHREILEEVNIKVKNIRYFKSQPWPFPGQLMLGFFAEYLNGKIDIDGEEICDAAWYSIDVLPQIPGEATIAGQLIRHHIENR